MLVLSRKLKESIVVGDDIKIVVLDISGKQVKLGIEAPEDVSVHREEIYHKLANELNSDPTENTAE